MRSEEAGDAVADLTRLEEDFLNRPTVSDIYGLAYLAGEEAGGRPGTARLIHQFSPGVVVSEDVARYFAGPEHWWPGDVAACRQATGRVLDVGCGAGRHAVVVAQAGHDVVGLDSSEQAVAVTRRRGVDARVGGLLDLPPGLGTFDTFLFAGGGLFLLGGPRAKEMLRELAEIANPGAQIVGTNVAVAENETAASTSELGIHPEDSTRYRIRLRHGSHLSDWSQWETVDRPSLTQLRTSGRESGWQVEESNRATAPFAPGVGNAAASSDADGEALENGTVAIVTVRMRLTS